MPPALTSLPGRGSIQGHEVIVMRTNYLRATLAGGLFAVLLVGTAPLDGLFAQSSGAQQDQTQQPPVSVPSAPNEQQKTPDQYTMTVEVPLVTLDVVVADDNGNPVTGLSKGNFRVSEDGVPQSISNFATPDAPITCVMLLETRSPHFGGYPVYMANAVNWSWAFISQLKKDDWLALAYFDMRTHYDVDFTQNKMAVRDFLSTMRMPGFSESNVFDAVIETLDRLKDVKGRKSILLLASGIDTFSKHTWDDTQKRLKQTDVTIFPVSVSQFVEIMQDNGLRPGGANLTFLQADNQMREMARLTGGESFFPRFDGEIPSDMQQIAAMLRSQYSLGYMPTNQTRDGKYRKIKVEAVGTDGKPLEVLNEKHKKLKLVIYARQGYTAPKGPVS